LKQVGYTDYQQAFNAAKVTVTPSELHGQLAGYLCIKPDPQAVGREYDRWLGTTAGKGLAAMLDELVVHTIDELHEYGDFQFRILMPDDGGGIDRRTRALGEFCAGFLAGAGLALTGNASLPPGVTEVLTDFERIAALGEVVPESNENEADLTEIVEYVRVSVLLVYAEFGGKRTV
jgi:uncharacterized protein